MNRKDPTVNDRMEACEQYEPVGETIWHYPISLFVPTYLVLPKHASFLDVVVRPETSQPHVYVQHKNLGKLSPADLDKMGRDPHRWEMWELRAYRAGMALDESPGHHIGTVLAREGLCKSFVYARYMSVPPFSRA